MSSSVSKKQKIKALKQVVPLQIPKDTAEPPAEEIFENGTRLFRKMSSDGKVNAPRPRLRYAIIQYNPPICA